MSYLLNTEISDAKPTSIALRKIFGLGSQKSDQICLSLGISKKTPIKFLTAKMKNKIILYVENNIIIGDDLKQKLNKLKTKQISLKTYRGQRTKFKLPRRGQRTRTNAKTVKKFN